MEARVQKWGSSLAVRIPEVYAAQIGLTEDAVVEVDLIDGQLVIRQAARTRPTLEELLRGVTPENLHGEWDTGPAVGDEVW